MKVFASNYLESMSDGIIAEHQWSWEPIGGEVKKIYASGNNTSSQQTTYAAEKDNRSDKDSPKEGRALLFAA